VAPRRLSPVSRAVKREFHSLTAAALPRVAACTSPWGNRPCAQTQSSKWDVGGLRFRRKDTPGACYFCDDRSEYEAVGRAAEKKRQWFNHGASALSALEGEGHGYVCPLCLFEFDESELADLSFEHAPPRSLGGRPVALTCRSCNSHAGARMDAHAERAEAHLDFATGSSGRPIRGMMRTDEAVLRGNFQRVGDQFRFFGVPQANPPWAPQQQMKVLDRWRPDPVGKEFKFQSSEPWSDSAVSACWLRAAYLVAFAKWGYSYILQDELEVVRHQIKHPDQHILPSTRLVQPSASRDRRAVYLTDTPRPSVVIVMARRIVLLPHPPSASFFEGIAQELEGLVAADPVWMPPVCASTPWPLAPEYLSDRNQIRANQRNSDRGGDARRMRVNDR
jgi:hypothetical protein